MKFFFIRDYEKHYRYFSSEPFNQIQVNPSRLKKLWVLAKKKLMLLPQRIMRQEQALAKVLRLEEKKIQIVHSGRLDEKKIRHKFYFFLQRQRTKHILFLAGELILLPLSGLAALLPGPNVFFGVLALLIITHWQALRGINKTLRKEQEFIPSPLFHDWEEALEQRGEGEFPRILEKIENEYSLEDIRQVLWK
jgi:hypothetical protein